MTNTSGRSVPTLVLACLGLAASLAACSSKSAAGDKGGLVVVLASDQAFPQDLDRVRVQVTAGTVSLLDEDHAVGPGQLLVPAQFRVRATGSSTPVVVRAAGFKDGVVRVERSAVTPIPVNRVGVVRLALNYLCDGTAVGQPDGSVISTCPAGLTCVQGTCLTTTVLPTSLPTYDQGAGGATGTSGTTASSGCFDVQTCFAAATAAVVDPATCVVTLPPGTDPATVNVALRLPLGAGGACDASNCWVAFDQGTDWTVLGSTLQLPTGVCTNALARGATVVLTVACNAKTEAQPICGPWSSAVTPAPQPPAMTMPSSPVGQSCAGATSQACGVCGAQTRTCTNGAWSTWSACGGEGSCLAGATRSCGANGMQTCGADCQWAPCGCASDQRSCAGACTSVQTDVHNCGTCGSDCALLPHVAGGSARCVAGRCAYACAAGYAECGQSGGGCATSLMVTTSCGACAVPCGGSTPSCAPVTPAPSVDAGAGGASGAAYACASGCPATAPTLCGGSCVDLTTSAEHCGKCDTICASGATCQAGQCTCATGTTLCGDRCADLTSDDTSCGKCGNACPQGASCQSGACQCKGPATQACGNCGLQARTCTDGQWSDWSACSAAAGACAPSTTKACTNGTQTCDSTCQWATCACQTGYQSCSGACLNTQTDSANCGRCGHACATGTTCMAGACTCTGVTTQACGHCGTQTRTCNDGTLSAWSACGGEGLCAPGDVVSCDATSVKTCSATCQWSACVGCSGPSSQACGNCGTQTRTCTAGAWSGWSTCTMEGPCAPNAALDCGNGGQQTCGSTCQWSSCAEPDRNATAWHVTGPSYVVMSDTVIDQTTQLEWQRAFTSGVTQAAGVAGCAALNLNGPGRWRLPTLNELFSIIDLGRVSPATDPNVFPGIGSENFLTANGSTVVYFAVGVDSGNTAAAAARCVRDAVANRPTSTSFSFPATGVGLDARTGLTWQLGTSALTMFTNAAAAGYCSTLSLGAFSGGWRLPTGHELASIRNPTTSNRQVIGNFGAAVDLWSSTPYAFTSTSSWALRTTGVLAPQALANPYAARCVHD